MVQISIVTKVFVVVVVEVVVKMEVAAHAYTAMTVVQAMKAAVVEQTSIEALAAVVMVESDVAAVAVVLVENIVFEAVESTLTFVIDAVVVVAESSNVDAAWLIVVAVNT